MKTKGKRYTQNLKLIGKRIQILRKERGYTQKELAEELEITRVYMGYIEQGRESPSLNLMFRLADVFGVKLQVLLEI